MRIEFKKIKKIFGKAFLFIVRHDFLTCLFLIFLSLVFGASLIYKYTILTQKIEPEILDQPFLIQENDYQNVLNIWQEQEKIFQEADSKEYPNPFKPTLEATSEATQ